MENIKPIVDTLYIVQQKATFWTLEFPIIAGICSILILFFVFIWLMASSKDGEMIKRFGGRKAVVVIMVFFVGTQLLISRFIAQPVWKEIVKWLVAFFVGGNILEYGGSAIKKLAENGQKKR